MSTKLYNGYKLNNLSVAELKEFTDFIKEKLHKVLLSEYKTIYSHLAINMIDELVTRDVEFAVSGDIDAMDSFMISLYKQAYLPVWIANDFLSGKSNLTITDALEQLQYPYFGSVSELAKDMIKQKVFIFNTKETNIGSFDLQNEMALFPTEDKILFMAYGTKFEKVLSDILSSKSKVDRDFRNKFGFQYYGYWNNTDRPKGISQKAWEARGKEWSDVLNPDWIPGRHGICLEIIPEDVFLSEMEYSDPRSNGKSKFLSPEDRAKMMSEEESKKEYLRKNNVSSTNVATLVMEYDEKKKNGDFDKEISDKAQELAKLLPVVEDEDLKKRLLDFAPNYTKAKNL